MRGVNQTRRIWLLLAAAVFMRAIIPTGWMPDTSRNDALVVTVCNGGYQVVIPLGRDDAPVDSKAHGSSPCLYAGFGGDAPLGSLAPQLAAPPPPAQVRIAVLAPLALARTPRVTPPSHAPPILS